MHQTKKLLCLSLGLLVLTACSTNPPEYFPGYYQEARYHSARYERPYYDYYGNYHAGYVNEAYEEPGRWHRASVLTVDNMGKVVYTEPSDAEREAEIDVGQMAADKDDTQAVMR